MKDPLNEAWIDGVAIKAIPSFFFFGNKLKKERRSTSALGFSQEGKETTTITAYKAATISRKTAPKPTSELTGIKTKALAE